MSTAFQAAQTRQIGIANLVKAGQTVSVVLLFSLAFWEFDLLRVGPVKVTDSELIIAAVVCFMALKCLIQRRLPFFDRFTVIAMVLMGLSMTASSLATEFQKGIAVKYTIRFFAAVALTVSLSDLLRDRSTRRLALRVLLGASIAFSILGLLEHFFFDQLSGFFATFKSSRFTGTDVSANLSYSSGAFWEGNRLIVRASSVFVYCNSMAYFLVMVCFFALFLQGDAGDRQRLPFRLAMLGFLLYVLTLTFSRGAFATLLMSALLCGLIVLVRFGFRSGGFGLRRKMLILLGVIALLATINLGFFSRLGSNVSDIWHMSLQGGMRHQTIAGPDGLADSLKYKLALRDIQMRGSDGLAESTSGPAPAGSFELKSPDLSPVTFESGGSLFSRIQLWRAAWDLFLENPWLGVGPDNYRMLFHRKLRRFNYDLYISKGIYRPHNLLLNFLSEGGIVGGLTLLLFLAALLRLAVKIWRLPLFEPKHVALLGALLVFLIANAFDVMSFDYYSDSILIATMIALLSMESRPVQDVRFEG